MSSSGELHSYRSTAGVALCVTDIHISHNLNTSYLQTKVHQCVKLRTATLIQVSTAGVALVHELT